MKENKNIVFGLKSFTNTSKTETAQWTQDGLLVFPEHAKATHFLTMCETMMKNHQQKPCHYEIHGWVRVGDFIADRTASQKHFYVRDGDYEELSAEEIAQIGQDLSVTV